MFVRLLLFLFAIGTPAFLLADDSIRDAVVKIHVTQRPPDFIRPWTKSRPSESSGSGVVISGNRILTNAHVVLYASRVHVQANQSSKRELAEVIAVAPEMDLAVITVKNESFFEDRTALEISPEIPKLKETINVYGYPIGGEQMSITEGIISRIECSSLAFSGVGVRLQIDAALNPGNSGGPALINDKVVGLAFSGVRQADNIGYVIGAEEIERFLANIPDGEYSGKPALYEKVQTVENESLRSWLKLDDEQGGLFVAEPYSDDETYPIKKFDVITKLGDYALDRQGNVQVSNDLKLSYQYLVPRLAQNEMLPATVVRDGEIHEVKIPLKRKRDLLIKSLKGEYPSFFIYGPMIFTHPSQELLGVIQRALVGLSALGSPLANRRMDKPAFDGEQLVILGARLFPHSTSEGYKSTGFAVVTHINDTAVKNLAHAAKLLNSADGEYIELKLLGSGTKFLTFKREEIEEATELILEDEGIRTQYSKDIRAVWGDEG